MAIIGSILYCIVQFASSCVRRVPLQEWKGSPTNPGGQEHRKLPSLLWHRASLPHGALEHSSTSWHPAPYASPVYPSGHSQWCPPGKFVHSDPGPQAFGRLHSLTSKHCGGGKKTYILICYAARKITHQSANSTKFFTYLQRLWLKLPKRFNRAT